MNLFKASQQWSNRPDDERFASLPELHAAVSGYRATAAEASVSFASLRTEARDGEVLLVGKSNTPARLTHYAFGQVAAAIGAPASYLRDLPATLAAQNLNHGLAKTEDRTDRQVLFHQNGSLLARAVTSDRYTRIWNSDITKRLLDLPSRGWRVPPARPARAGQAGTRIATEADVLDVSSFGLSVKVGDEIAPAGLYASDHDMFVFLVNEQNRIKEAGNEQGLSRGFFITNSEVGAASFVITRFLLKYTCGNHIVWGAKDVSEIRLKHIGNAPDRAFRQLSAELVKYANESASDDEARIRTAMTFKLGGTKDEVLDKLFGLKSLGISRKTLDTAYDITVAQDAHLDPTTAWGVAQGLTRLSQQSAYADERVSADRAAGKVLSIAF